ncbi:chemotaxis protein CheW [Marinilabiliaceae bacterium ANBcel2]|nr:chemotaxis protein CheW [Marinilabiliaceae bacterium ANBcel2]
MSKNEKQTISSYLSFRLGGEIFAMNVNRVLKILEVPDITEVPKSPDYMKGVINLRGSVLPIVDTRIKFGLSAVEMTKNTSILVVNVDIEGEMINVGLLVDSVHAVLKLSNDELLSPPSLGSKYKSEFITSMARVKDKFFIVLNIDAVFSAEDHINIKELAGVRDAITKEVEKKSE